MMDIEKLLSNGVVDVSDIAFKMREDPRRVISDLVSIWLSGDARLSVNFLAYDECGHLLVTQAANALEAEELALGDYLCSHCESPLARSRIQTRMTFTWHSND